MSVFFICILRKINILLNKKIMWIITNLSIGLIIGFLVWRKFGGIFEAFYSGLMWMLCIHFSLFMMYDNRNFSDYEEIFGNKKYINLNTHNYSENRQLIIDTHYYPHSTESNFSNKTFCRIDLYQKENTPFKSYWVNKEDIDIVVTDSVIPHFKRLIKIKEKKPPLIYKLFLCPLFMEKQVNEFKGTLYLPQKPQWRECVMPSFVEYDIIKQNKRE